MEPSGGVHQHHVAAAGLGGGGGVKDHGGGVGPLLVAHHGHARALDPHAKLLGRGGAARAIAFEAVLTVDAPHLDIVCRESSLEKAQVLSDELAELCRTRSKTGVFRVLSYDELAKETGHYDLVLNTTSLGMYPKTGVSVVGEDVLSRCKAAFDAVYNPGETKFLKLAASCGLKTVGGMGMLVCQAVAAHELWYGASFKDSDIEQLICDAEAETARLFRA